ncbi:MAG: S8 family serine peptidase [Candidatus Limnocylindria bacterium]
MVRRLIVLVSLLALALPTAVLAQDPSGADRFQTSPSEGAIDPAILPIAMDDDRTVNVMVQLDGDPVAVVQAEADRELSRAERNAIKRQLKSKQDALKGPIAQRGGEVVNQLQSAYNGIRVNIARKDAASLASLPGVIGVRGLQVHTFENATSVPFLGVPSVWENNGFTGETISVGIIDTGLDYTHANFGGPGTVEAFEAADATDTAPADPAFFGPNAPKVKGGYDFSGDDYNASAPAGSPALIPQPDPNPLDCHGHGSHVGGTTGGFGVNADGSTYEGEYDESTHENEFIIGPGVAPEVDLYGLRVFGCGGSTDLTVDAIDWAVDNQLDVINMSLGSSFGRADDPSAVASTNAAAAGVIVVASAGNSGPNPYITGAPAAGDGAISVAATDSTETFPGVNLTFGDTTIQAINANGAELVDGPLEIQVLRNPSGGVSEGCDPQEYLDQDVAGKLVVTVRGTCARVARAVFGQKAGAAAVVMINTSASFPPFEGPITGNPDTGEEYEVTIPFLGVRGILGPAATDNGDALVAADGQLTTMTDAPITNPGFRGFASFSSGGPRNGDSALKPNVAAPGVSIQSTAVGTGTQGARFSGTSMAAPHVAGVAALVRESRPGWSVEDVSAAISNYADPSEVVGYRLTRGGTGLVDTAESVNADIVALGDPVEAAVDDTAAAFMTATLSYGFDELDSNYSATKTLTVRNHGESEATLQLGSAPSPQSVGGTAVGFSANSVTVPAGGSAEVDVTLSVPANVGTSSPVQGNPFQFKEASGNVTLTSGDTVLRVPYLLVPRSLSNIETSLDGPLTTNGVNRKQTATVTNDGGVLASSADVYAWGLEDPDDMDEAALGGSGYDVRAIGVQSFDAAPFGKDFRGDRLLVFAINNHDRWSTASVNEWDITIDSNGDGSPDYIVIGVDSGAIRTGSFNGLLEVFYVNIATNQLFASGFLATAPTDSSTLLLPIFASDLGLSNSNRSFEYEAVSFSLEGAGVDVVGGSASFNAYAPSITTGQYVVVPPGGSARFNVEIDTGEWKKTPAKGLMVVAIDNAAGAPEAQLVPAPTR